MPRKRNVSSPQEQAALSCYLEKLRREKSSLSEKTIQEYAHDVCSSGKATRMIQDAHLLPPEIDSLLLLHEHSASVPAILAWWQEHAKSSGISAAYRTALNTWFTVWLNVDKNQLSASRTTPKSLPLSEPHYHIRLLLLLQSFFYEEKNNPLGYDNAGTRYLSILDILTQNQAGLDESNVYASLQENESAFRSLKEIILANLQRSRDTIRRELCAKFNQWPLRRRHILEQCLQKHGSELLRCPDSPFLLLETLYTAKQPESIAEAVLCLVEKILRDCLPFSPDNETDSSPDAPIVLDPRLWTGNLLWYTLEQKKPDPSWIDACLNVSFPKDPALQSRFAADLFQNMLFLARDSKDQSSQNPDWFPKAIGFFRLHWKELQAALPNLSSPCWNPVPADQLSGGPESCVFYAKLLLGNARSLLLHLPDRKSDDIIGCQLMQAKESLRIAEKVLLRHKQDYQSSLEYFQNRQDTDLTLLRISLCEAELHLHLARLEREEVCLADAVQLYFTPARLALADAQDRLEHLLLSQDAPALQNELQSVLQKCISCFFQPESVVIQRLQTRSQTDSAVYQSEYANWQKAFFPPQTPSPMLPCPFIRQPLDVHQLLRMTDFQPVYSGAFDSVLGKEPQKQREPVELTLFQLLASGKVCLLQLNQIADNRTMLQLMPTPGFRWACRRGLVSLSCFQNIDNPKQYLCDRLRNQTFLFSSTSLYERPEFRELMLKCLLWESDLSAFPLEAREEAEFLLESYFILFECFQPSDLLRYHQNTKRRYPPLRASTPNRLASQPLREVITWRLNVLLHEASQENSGKNFDTLSALQTYATQWSHLVERSDYTNAVQQALTQTADPLERERLKKFQKLVDQSYFLANGRRSCETVLLTEDDPDFMQTSPETQALHDDRLTSLYRQSCLPATYSNLSWDDVCERAMIVRHIDLVDQKLSAQKRARRKAAETGLGFTSLGSDTFATDLSPKTSQGKIVHIAPNTQTSAQSLEIHRGASI